MDKVYNFNQVQIKDFLTKHGCHITIDKIVKVQDFLNEHHINLIEAIGCGALGAVLKGYDNYNQRNVAIKILSCPNPEIKKELEDKIKIHRKILSVYVIKIFEPYYDEESSCFMIVMEYCPKGDLHTYIQNKRSVEKDEIINIFTKILLGLIDIHKKNVIHSDLKPQNILLVDGQKPKISLLGLSTQNDNTSDKKGGAAIYESMESMCDRIRLESDYFSAGSILCFLSGLEIESDLMMMFQLKNGIFPDIKDKKQKELIEIGFQMMQSEASQRIKPEIAYDKLMKLKMNSQQIIQQSDCQKKKEEKKEVKKEEKNEEINNQINLEQQKQIALNQLNKYLPYSKEKMDFEKKYLKFDLWQIIVVVNQS